MSYKAMDWAFEQPIKDAGLKIVLLCICKHANDEQEAWPSMRRIAQLTGLSTRTVVRKIAELEAANYITKQRRFGKNGHLSNNVYKVSMVTQCHNPSDTEAQGWCHSGTIIDNNNISFNSLVYSDRVTLDKNNTDNWEAIAREIDNG
jgi:DNA-binding transcriptional MocR family regulator